MSYQLPQFDLSYGTEDGPIHYYTADQMQAAYQAGQADAREDLTIAYMAGYSKGRDSMKAECVKVCETFSIPDKIEGAHPDYVEGKRMAVAQLAHVIKELK